MKILLSGFEPFAGEKVNPAWEALKDLPDSLGAIKLIKLQLPTVFYDSSHLLNHAIDQHAPNVVIAVGQAGGEDCIRLERVAINLIDARIPDNKDYQPSDCPIIKDAPNAYFATLPLKRLNFALKQEGISSRLSYSAGTFVCNELFYSLMHKLAQSPHIRAGFVHVPYLPEQTRYNASPSMPLAQITKALKIIVQHCTYEDISYTAGELH